MLIDSHGIGEDHERSQEGWKDRPTTDRIDPGACLVLTFDVPYT
jgi:hypothetical protein